jgi:hypothetical protein
MPHVISPDNHFPHRAPARPDATARVPNSSSGFAANTLSFANSSFKTARRTSSLLSARATEAEDRHRGRLVLVRCPLCTFNVAMPRAVVAVSAHRISVEVIVSRVTFF